MYRFKKQPKGRVRRMWRNHRREDIKTSRYRNNRSAYRRREMYREGDAIRLNHPWKTTMDGNIT
jgi:hypothetical protein